MDSAEALLAASATLGAWAENEDSQDAAASAFAATVRQQHAQAAHAHAQAVGHRSLAEEAQLMAETSRDGLNLLFKTVRQQQQAGCGARATLVGRGACQRASATALLQLVRFSAPSVLTPLALPLPLPPAALQSMGVSGSSAAVPPPRTTVRLAPRGGLLR